MRKAKATRVVSVWLLLQWISWLLLGGCARGDLLMDTLGAFVDPSAMMQDGKEMLDLAALAANNATNGSGYQFDDAFPLSRHEMGLLLQFADKCLRHGSIALRSWCVGASGSTVDSVTLCPGGVTTHPCTGRVLGTDRVEYLWPWQGIKCDAFTDPTTVTHIYLPGQKLKCRLQDLDFSQMVSLEQLDLGQNDLYGPFPSWLGNMTVLRFLNLRENKLAGRVPLSFGDNIALEVVDLAKNQFTAASLSFFNILKRLRYLDLSENLFNLSLPQPFLRSNHLEHINLSHNAFHGPLPDLPPLTSLASFDVSNNSFEGPLPRSLSTWGLYDLNDPAEQSLLRHLDFSYNRFNGSVPSIAKHAELEHFAVQFNKLDGLLPALPASLIRANATQFYDGNDFLCPLPQLTPHASDLADLTCRCVHNRQSTGQVGTVPATIGADQCQVCAPGSYANDSSNFQCQACPVGHITMAEGYQVSAVACVPCPPGSFSAVVGGVQCTLCPEGTFTASSGQAACQRCAPGTFADQVGATQCQRCPPGTAASTDASATCGLCSPGTFAPDDGEISCLPCPRGQFQDQSAAESCVDCPMGHIAQRTGQTQCVPCPQGTFFEASVRTCVVCPPNTFTDEPASTECRVCEAGTVAEGFGRSRCEPVASAGNGRGLQGQVKPCLPGYFNNGSFVTCQPCVVGSYAAGVGSSECKPCKPGSFAAVDAAVKCEQAPVGTFVDEPAASGATPCPPGQFSNSEGSKACTPCPRDSTSVYGGSDRCEPLVDGEVLQRISWPQSTLRLVGVHSVAVRANESVRAELLRCWQDALFANGVSGVASHIVDVAANLSTPYQSIVRIAVEQLPPKRPNRRPRRGGLLGNLSQAYGQVDDVRDSARNWLDGVTGKTNDDYTRLAHANVSQVIPSEEFRLAFARQLSHSAIDTFQTAATLLDVRLTASPFTSIRAIKCPRGSYFTHADGDRTCVLCPVGTYADDEGSVGACKPCPVRHYGDEEGLDRCWTCPFGHGALAGSTSCARCNYFSHACGDFWQHVVLTVVIATAVGVKFWLRTRIMWRGASGVQHQSEATALVAAVRAFGRVPWEPTCMDTRREISVDTLLSDTMPPPAPPSLLC